MSTPLRVLIIDDSADDAAMSLLELRENGYAYVTELVDTADELTDALDRQSWDIILSDHQMPSFSAPDALRVAQARVPGVPFIIVSGNIADELVASLVKTGATGFVHKDNIDALAPAVGRALRAANDAR